MTKATRYGLLGAALLICVISVPLVAGPFGGPWGSHFRGTRHMLGDQRPDMERHFKAMAKELNLSVEQQTKLTATRDAFRSARIDLQASIEKMQFEIEKAMRPENKTTDAQMQSLFEQKAGLRAKMEMEFYRLRTGMRNVLTPEQREKMETLMSDHGGKMRERMHGRMGMMQDDRQDGNSNGGDSDRMPAPPHHH